MGESFYCLLTDRGILLSLGQGAAGCLGHGDTLDLASPRIVEALLGDDITRLAAGPAHVAVVSGDGELFTWGESGGAYMYCLDIYISTYKIITLFKKSWPDIQFCFLVTFPIGANRQCLTF